MGRETTLSITVDATISMARVVAGAVRRVFMGDLLFGNHKADEHSGFTAVRF